MTQTEKDASIGTKVRAARASLPSNSARTIANCAAAFGVSADTWSKWERGVTSPSRQNIELLKQKFPAIFEVKRRLRNKIALVLDNSGSMTSYKKEALAAFNKNISDWASIPDQENEISVIMFDTRVHLPIRRNMLIDSSNVRQALIREDEYNPGGSTALFDAVRAGIIGLQSSPVPIGVDVAYILIVVTDGFENISCNIKEAKRLMQDVQGTDRWTLTFQLPRGNANEFSRQHNVPLGNCLEWDLDQAGIQEASRHTTLSVMNYASARRAGARSSKSFYTTDMSNVSSQVVRSKLDDVSDKVKVWEVKGETDIRSFCEGRSRKPLLKGAAFYQLTKTEKKVQDHKLLAIREKGKPGVFVGPNARQLLGLPISGTVKVVPGNHGNFDIFVQSTSTNRKLVRGTNVIYYPGIGKAFTEGPSASV
jgi:transcriptional regulator with XRE-family HTH domain